MRTSFRISSLVPSGLVVESVSVSADSIFLAARSKAGMALCPLCGSPSHRIHSQYIRQVADLPCAGRQIRLRVIARRFVCEVQHSELVRARSISIFRSLKISGAKAVARARNSGGASGRKAFKAPFAWSASGRPAAAAQRR